MIKIKLNEIIGILTGIATITEQRMPVKLAYWFNKINDKLTAEQKVYDNMRVKLCVEYCDKDSDNNPMIEDGRYLGLEDNIEFKTKLLELFDIEAELDIDPLSITMLETADIKITGAELSAISKIIGDTNEV
jgi:hypothetical protein